MNSLLEQYLVIDIDGAFGYTDQGKQYCQSVHFGESRFKEAERQNSKPVVAIEIIEEEILAFLEKVGIRTTKKPRIDPKKIDYREIQKEYSLNSEKDLVWLKFANNGHLGVVATSNDVNFQIPKNKSEYNSAGIILHNLGLKWDESFVLLFPLGNIPNGYRRHDIERAIGNFLYKKGVPILDLYSHLY